MAKTKKPKPQRAMSSYAAFVKRYSQEQKKKHPGKNLNFIEFSKKCSEKWGDMSERQKQPFVKLSEKDRAKKIAVFQKAEAKSSAEDIQNKDKAKKRKSNSAGRSRSAKRLKSN